MFARTKEFIESHKNLINQNKFYDLFKETVNTLVTHEINELACILEEALDVPDLDDLRWQVFESEVKDYVDYYLNQIPAYMKNRSEDWSRVDYMLEEISDLGFGGPDVKAYVIKNGQNMGLKIKALEPQYGWYGSGDYDLGWFNKVEFDKEND